MVAGEAGTPDFAVIVVDEMVLGGRSYDGGMRFRG